MSAPDNGPPLVKGGQGRSRHAIEKDASAIVRSWLWLLSIVVALLGIASW